MKILILTGKKHLVSDKTIGNLWSQGRLSTGDRLARLGLNVEQRCVLCSSVTETHEHLFFQCPVAAQVWESVQKDEFCSAGV